MQYRFVADHQEFLKLSAIVQDQAWRYGFTYGPQSSKAWHSDLSQVPQLQQMWQTINAQGFVLDSIIGLAQTHRQDLVQQELEPQPHDPHIWQWHSQTLWQPAWHGATVIDGDRVEYEPNLLIDWPAYLPVTHEYPRPPDTIRIVVQFLAHRVI